MPVEAGRTTKRKQLLLPSGTRIDIPVITRIVFIDPVRRGQEIEFTVENLGRSDRLVRVDQIHDSQGSGTIDVERCNRWQYIDPVRRGQETQMNFDNQYDANGPPFFISHQKTHLVKYHASTNSGDSWVESELIDEFWMLDPVRRGQETRFVLLNPADGEVPPVTGDPDITDTGNGVDPPWRTDPFQNLIRFHDTEANPSGGAQLWGFAAISGQAEAFGGAATVAIAGYNSQLSGNTPPLPGGEYVLDMTNGPGGTFLFGVLGTFSGTKTSVSSSINSGGDGTPGTVSFGGLSATANAGGLSVTQDFSSNFVAYGTGQTWNASFMEKESIFSDQGEICTFTIWFAPS